LFSLMLALIAVAAFVAKVKWAMPMGFHEGA
jgi:hypothetical protein